MRRHQLSHSSSMLKINNNSRGPHTYTHIHIYIYRYIQIYMCICGFRKIRGNFFRAPIVRIRVCSGLYWSALVWETMVWYGMVWYGMVWYGKYVCMHACMHVTKGGARSLDYVI